MTSQQIQPHQLVPLAPEKLLVAKRIVWAAMLFSHGVFYVVGNTIIMKAGKVEDASLASADSGVSFMSALDHPMALTISLIAILVLGASFLVPKLLEGIFARAKNKDEMAFRARTQMIPFVLGCALNEVVATLGFAGGFVALKNASFGSLLILISLFAMLSRFPKKSESGSLPTGVREG